LRNTPPNQNQFDGPVTGPDELPKIPVLGTYRWVFKGIQKWFAHLQAEAVFRNYFAVLGQRARATRKKSEAL